MPAFPHSPYTRIINVNWPVKRYMAFMLTVRAATIEGFPENPPIECGPPSTPRTLGVSYAAGSTTTLGFYYPNIGGYIEGVQSTLAVKAPAILDAQMWFDIPSKGVSGQEDGPSQWNHANITRVEGLPKLWHHDPSWPSTGNVGFGNWQVLLREPSWDSFRWSGVPTNNANGFSEITMPLRHRRLVIYGPGNEESVSERIWFGSGTPVGEARGWTMGNPDCYGPDLDPIAGVLSAPIASDVSTIATAPINFSSVRATEDPPDDPRATWFRAVGYKAYPFNPYSIPFRQFDDTYSDLWILLEEEPNDPTDDPPDPPPPEEP